MKRFFAILMAFFLVISGLPIQSANAVAYDPVTKTEGDATLDLRFWEDQKPDIGFYINAGNRYLLETVTAPQFGTGAGEWSVMDILRGYYTGYDYLNYVPENYYKDYLERVERYVIANEGNLDRNKSTEWSRSTLSLSALGHDIRSVGEAGDYLYVKFVTTYQGEKTVDTSNSSNHFALKLNGDTVVFDQEYGLEFNYTSQQSGKVAKGFAIVPAGTYTLDRATMQLRNEQNEIVSVPYTEMYRGQPVTTHNVDTLYAGDPAKKIRGSLLTLEKPYDYIEKLSASYRFSYRQGINGPIWTLIALDTGGYELYTEEQLTARGVTIAKGDVNTKGRMIDYILSKEITNTAGRVGGWALSGKNADPDITMMAIQSLAPYYLDEEKFKNAYRTTIDATTGTFFDVDAASFKEKYTAFKQAVERGVYVMAQDQKPNGGYASMGIINSESTVQVIVGLTALGIDPLSESVYLPTINQTVSFIKEGGTYDGVWSNNVIDALTAFWAMGSGSSSEVGGFKHVTTGYDSGGGAGTTVNGMATDQAIYGLIAYDRFLKKEKRLYDMTDMMNGEYKTMKAKEHAYTYMVDDATFQQGTFSPYEVLTIPQPPTKDGFKGIWTTQADGTGAVYKPGERLSTPDHPITLYAQYIVPYEITYELNDGKWLKENAEEYSPTTWTITLPTAEHIHKENHVFDGWYATADFQGELVTAFNDPNQLQQTVYAKWLSFETLVANAETAINELPVLDKITVESAAQIVETRNIYNRVPSQVLENVTNVQKLLDAENLLKVYAVQDSIANLPIIVHLSHSALFEELTAAINEIPNDLQAKIDNIHIYNEKLAILQDLQQQASDQDYADVVRDLINALPKEMTLAHEEQFKEAKEAYNQLTNTQRNLLTIEYILLNTLEDQLNTLLEEQQLAQISAQIEDLPDISTLSIEDKEAIMQVYETFLALSSTQQHKIDSRKLNRTVAAFIELQIDALPATLTEADKPTLNEIRYLYQEADYTITNLVTNYKKLEQAYVALEDAPLAQKAHEVIAKINLIPATVTLSDKAMIQAARTAYDALTIDEKKLVENYSKLTQAEKIVTTLESTIENDLQPDEQIKAQIANLPAIGKLTVADKETVIKVYEAYLALPFEQREAVDSRQLNRTVAALIELQIDALPASITEADKPTLNEIRYLYQEADYKIQSLVTNYKKLEQAYVTLENAPFVEKANVVIAKINLIPADVTLAAKPVIEAARTAYEALIYEEKTFVTNAYKLEQAENKMASLENSMKNDVNRLVNEIRQLPATITLTHKSTVTTLQTSYNALSSTAKAQVTNYQTLVNAVQAIATLETQDKQIVQAMQAAITALPDAASITINHQFIIEDVRTKYNSLTATQKASIDSAKLVAAEAQLKKLLNTNHLEDTDSAENPPASSDQLVTETNEKLIVHAVSNGSESIASITPNWIQSLTAPLIEVDTNTGIRVIVPKNALKQYTKAIQVSTKIHHRGTERSIDVTFGTMDGSQYIARRASTPFTIRIPASVFMAPQASTTALAFEPGVILGYSADKGYYAVPHIYENGEFIVTASEGHTLVYRTEHITFDDIQGSIFQDEIEYLASRFVIKGFDDANFRPDDKITRGQFAALISRALDLKPTKATTFRDGFYSEFRDDMQAVYEAGIMRGYSDTKFGTNEPLTREQAAATMARVLEYMDYEAKRNLVHFKDKEEIDPAFVKQIELLNTLNIMSGHGDGSFKPKDQLTRGQLAKILQRTLALTKVM